MEVNTLKQALYQALSQAELESLAQLSQEAIATYPDQAFGYYFYGEQLLLSDPSNLNHLDWAFGRACNLEAENTAYLLKYAQVKEQFGELDEAAQTYALVLGLDPSNQAALLALAYYELSEQRQNPIGALDYLGQIENADAEVYACAAQAQMLLEAPQEALTLADCSLSEAFNGLAATTKIAALRALDRLNEAPPVYEAILELSPEDGAMLHEYARVLMELGENQSAQVYFEQALKHLQYSPDLAHLFLQPIAENFVTLGQYAQALPLWTSCLETKGHEEHRYYFYRAQTLAKLGQAEAAKADVQKMVELAESKLEVLAVEAKCMQAEILLELGELAQARALLLPLREAGLCKEDVALGIARLALAEGKAGQAYPELLDIRPMAQAKVEPLLRSGVFADYLQKCYAQASKSASPQTELQALWNKVWRLDTVKLPLPEGLDLNNPQMQASWEAYQAEMQKRSANYGLFADERFLCWHLPRLSEAMPPSGFYLYRLDKAQNGLYLLRLQAFDRKESQEIKLKIEGDTLLLNWGKLNFRYQVYQGQPEDLPYGLQKQFTKDFNYLQLPKLHSFSPQALPWMEELLNG